MLSLAMNSRFERDRQAARSLAATDVTDRIS
jgi:hypothetical protein